jgi:hypothetical protein
MEVLPLDAPIEFHDPVWSLLETVTFIAEGKIYPVELW